MNIKKYLPIMAGLCFSTIFGFTFMFSKEGLEVVSTFQLLGYRFGLAALVMTIMIFLGMIKVNYSNKEIGSLLLLATVQPGLYFIFEIQGINMTTSSEAGLMISLIPVVVTILAAIFLDEKPDLKQLIFIILSVAGVVFIVFMKGNSAIENNYLGMLILGGAVLMGGIYNILSRKLSLNFTPVEITYIMVWFGTIIFNCIGLIRFNGSLGEYFGPLTNLKVLIPVIYLGFFASIIAFFMMNYTLSKIRAFQSAVFANLTTVISIVAGVVFRNEPFYWFQFIGAAMIIVGVWGTNYFGKLEQPVEEIPA